MSLTPIQKKLLQFLVEQVNNEKLDGEEFWISWRSNGVILIRERTPIGSQGEIHIPFDVKQKTVEALEKYDYVSCYWPGSHEARCALTGKAYEAFGSNFTEPDRAAIPHLIPLTEVQHLDPELWERCRISLSAGGNDPKAWDKAVRTATVVLEERLRKLGNTDSINPDATGEGLVNLIFAGKNPVFGGKLDEKKRKAYRDLYAGMMGVFRNTYAHRFHDPSPKDGGAIIVFIDLLLKMLDDLDRDPENETS